MSQKIRCIECDAVLMFRDLIPARIECPECGVRFNPDIDEDDEPRRDRNRSRDRTDDEDTKPTPRRRRGDDDDNDLPRKKSSVRDRHRDDDNEVATPRKGRAGKKTSNVKKFPLWMPITIGGAVLATLLIIVLINALNKDDKKSVANNSGDNGDTPKNVPTRSTTATKTAASKTNVPKIVVPKNDNSNPPFVQPDPEPERPPFKDPIVPPFKDPLRPPPKDPFIPPFKDPDPPIAFLPPRKEPKKAPEDPAALIRSLDGNIQIPPLPPIEQRPVLVLNPNGHSGAVRKLLFSRDTKRLITVSMDKTIRVWDIATGDTIKTIYMPNGPGDEGSLFAAALTPDGKKVAVSGYPFGAGKHGVLIYLVSLETGKIERTFTGHRGAVSSLSFNGNGQWLVSASGDGTALLFKTASGESGGELKGHKGALSMVAYHPKEPRVATACYDGTARIWMTLKRKRPTANSSRTRTVR